VNERSRAEKSVLGDLVRLTYCVHQVLVYVSGAQRILVALEVNLNRETNVYVDRGRGTRTLLRPLQTPLWIRS